MKLEVKSRGSIYHFPTSGDSQKMPQGRPAAIGHSGTETLRDRCREMWHSHPCSQVDGGGMGNLAGH